MTGSRRTIDTSRSRDEFWAGDNLRILFFGAVMLAGLLVLAVALYFEQVRYGEAHRERITRQSIRRIRIPARRGRIFTSDLKVLADNKPELNLIFYPEEMRYRRRKRTVMYMHDAAERLASAIGRENTLTRVSIERHLNTRPGLPLTVFNRLTPEEAALAMECSRSMRGVEIQSDSHRVYPAGNLASNIVGYARLESPGDASDREDFFYYLPDLAGKEGIELACDRIQGGGGLRGLRGEPGYSLVQVDHLGYIHRNLIEKIEPLHGNNVVLTVDSVAQEIAQKLLNGRRGAMVVVDAGNGDVLAAATAPGVDLAGYSPVLSRAYYRQLLNDPWRPLFDRALRGTYTPGSILKPLVALAFLNAGVSPGHEVYCDGYSHIGNASIRCAAYRRGGHGAVDMRHALRWSCNSYFISHAVKCGAAPIRRVLAAAGIGERSGVGIAEGQGVFPADEAKRRIFSSRWNVYDTALLSMGQGIITLTPLQAAMYCAAIANGGILYRPNLVWRINDSAGNVLFERTAYIRNRLPVSSADLEVVRQGMFEVINTADGSGRAAKVKNLKIYGKTGSAEVGSRQNRIVNTWFIAFAEFKGRKLAMAILTEEGSSGGRDCAPLAAAFFRQYLELDGAGKKAGDDYDEVEIIPADALPEPEVF